MDDPRQFSLTIIIPLTILTCIFAFIIKRRSSTQKTNLPPGPPKLPLIGNLHQLVSKTTLPHHRLAELATIYGPIMHLHLGEVPTVVISSADVAKEVMKTHDAVLCSRPCLMLPHVLFYNSTDIAWAPYGEYWRQVRKLATLELFTTKRVQAFSPIREEVITNLYKSLVSEDGCLVNLSQKIFRLNFDISARLAFGMKGKDQEEFRALLDDITEISSGFSLGDLYPSMKFIYSISGMKYKLEKIVKRSNEIMDPIIQEHISRKKEGKQEDFLDVLLTFHKQDIQNDSYFSLATDNIKAIVLELFGGGSETSSTVIEWAMSELLKNPRVMAKAQDEVRTIFQGKSIVDDTCLNELKYLKLVIKETMRLHPPFPFLLPRESIDKCQINGYEIPTKTRIFINSWAIGRDPKYWNNPTVFNPERFESSSIDFKGTHFELIPFGAGRRICPGIALGMATIELTLAMLLKHFNWKLPHASNLEDFNMDETFGIVARRKYDLNVIPIRYN